MIPSTFSGFTSALSGMSASQAALNLTGQNINNLNTIGYTRQRLDLCSIQSPGNSSFSMSGRVRMGQGVMMTGVVQLRDPYLDYQYRRQLGKVGTVDAQNQVLDDIGAIFDKVDGSDIQTALDDVVSQLQDLSTKVGEDGNDNMVRASFEALLNYLHDNAGELKEIRETLIEKMENTIVPQINEILNNIKELNETIKQSEIMGNPALELKDQRNQLIDDLATYLPIEVSTRQVDVGGGFTVEELDIKIKGSDSFLVSHDQVGQVGIDASDPYNVKIGITEYDPATGTMVTYPDRMDTIEHGILKGNLDMLNKKGSPLDDSGTPVKGIGYYEDLLDSYASTLATKLNEMNVEAGGGPLFETSDGSAEFTASNIRISEGWMDGTTHIVPSTDPDAGSSANDNILRMKNLLSTDKLKFEAKDSNGKTVVLFEGTMPGAYTNIQNTQGIQKKSITSMLSNQVSVMNEIATNREAVSGVSLDEEVMNLMRYRQSYTAASRVMTTMDEALNILLSSTGVVGR